MKRFLSLLLMLTLLAGMAAMGQTRARHKMTKKSRARTERLDQRKGAKVAKAPETERADVQKTDAPMQQVMGTLTADAPKPRIDGEIIYTEVDEMPMFPGGLDGLMEYLRTNIVYPPVPAENGVQGKVLVQFVVEKDGSVGQVKILRSVEINLDYEAIRLCKSMPKFEPGKLDGKPVRVLYTLPINFTLED